jgi:hypothetical protein
MKWYQKEFQLEWMNSDKKPMGKIRRKINKKVRTENKKEIRKAMNNGTANK